MTTANSEPCPLCAAANTNYDEDLSDTRKYYCQRCKQFQITREALFALKSPVYQRSLYLLRGHVRAQYERQITPIIRQDTIDIILNDRSIPRTPMEKLGRLLAHVAAHSNHFGSEVRLHESSDSAVIYASAEREFTNLLHLAMSEGLIIGKNANAFMLTYAGFQHVERMKIVLPDSTQAFVAMWFDDSMKPVYDNAIQPALDENGYNAKSVDRIEHDGKIDDLIIAEIRKSRILVADFTGHRPGVYYEAGFAQGLGIPVVRTCRSDAREDLHFDTRQYNHIIWQNVADLKTHLSNRIAALYPLGPKSVAE